MIWVGDQQEDEDEDEEKAVIGFWSAFSWLVGMTAIIAVLSEYVVGTIEVYKYIYNFQLISSICMCNLNLMLELKLVLIRLPRIRGAFLLALSA